MKHDDYENMQWRKFYHDNVSHHAEVNGQKYNVFISSYLHKGKSNTLQLYTELSTTLVMVISRIRDSISEIQLWRL